MNNIDFAYLYQLRSLLGTDWIGHAVVAMLLSLESSLKLPCAIRSISGTIRKFHADSTPVRNPASRKAWRFFSRQALALGRHCTKLSRKRNHEKLS